MVIDPIATVITEEENNVLNAPFQPQEFKDKCPDMDKFNPEFFFNIVGLFVILTFLCECCMWLNNNQFPPSLNSTNISLIPKGGEHKSVKD